MIFKHLFAAGLIAFWPALAFGQGAVLQGGPWVAGHAPLYANPNGPQPFLGDSGPASGGALGLGLSELNITSRGNGNGPFPNSGTGPLKTHGCFFDTFATSPAGYHYLCFDSNAQGGGGLIAYGAANGAAQAPLYFSINNTLYQFPINGTGTGNVVGPNTSTQNGLPLWNNTAGTLLRDGSGQTIQGNYTFAGHMAMTGLATGTPANAQCLDASNNVITNPVNCSAGNVNAKVNFNGVNWTYTTPSPNSYVLFPFNTTAYNNGSIYVPNPGGPSAPVYSTANPPANTYFKPPAGAKQICFFGSVFSISGTSLGSGHNGVVKIIKDFTVNSSGVVQAGTDVGESQGFAYYGNTNAAWSLSTCDQPLNSNEYYGVFIDADGAGGSSGGDSITIGGNTIHTQINVVVVY